MDFAQFNTRDGAEEGRFLHFTHIETGAALYDPEADGDDKRVGIWLRGMESKSVQSAARAAQRAALKHRGATDDDDGVETAKALVLRFQHISRDDKLLTTSDDDLKWFFGLSSRLVNQVTGFASQPANFLPAA